MDEKITDRELREISQISLADPHLSFRPLSLLKQSAEKGHLLTIRRRRALMGWMECFPLLRDYWSVSSLYIRPSYRGKRIGINLLLHALRSVENKYVYAATANLRLKRELLGRGFRRVSLREIPIPVLFSLVIKRYSDPRTWNKLLGKTFQSLQHFWRMPQK